MNEYIKDYLDGGIYDHLEDPRLFAELMSDRNWITNEYYCAGITALETWYGDKSARNYADWFDALDAAFLQAENIFFGRLNDE
jgi:hypothetical protein